MKACRWDMVRTDHLCKIVRVLVTTHSYGTPLTVDDILKRAAVPSNELGELKDAVDRARKQPFVVNKGSRGIMLDNGAFQALIQFLHDECDWDRFELELRLKHFEGWEEIDW